MKIVFEDSGAGDLRNFIIQLCHIPNGRCRTRYLGRCIIFDDWQFGNSGLSQTNPITVNIIQIFNLILWFTKIRICIFQYGGDCGVCDTFNLRIHCCLYTLRNRSCSRDLQFLLLYIVIFQFTM